MPDDKSKRGNPDASKLSKEQDYEIAYLTYRHDISTAQARELVSRHGTNRARLDAAARELKQVR